MDEQQLQADPFLQLLTDALRAGPGSPEWHQAVARVRAGETGTDDEYALLLNARENLASGKSYRQVRAGAGFTRKMLDNIEKDAAAGKKSPISASLISYIGAGLIVASLSVVMIWLIQAGGGPAQPEDLTSQFFGRTIASATMDAPLSSAWRLIGPMQVDPAHGLSPTLKKMSRDYIGAAVVSTAGVPANKNFAVEATFQFNTVGDNVIPQLFVTDDPNFNADKATSPHELVWMVRGGLAQVALPNLELAAGSVRIGGNQSVLVRIVVGVKEAVILCDGRILWSGPNQLAGVKPRFVGVRLLCKQDSGANFVTVRDLREIGK